MEKVLVTGGAGFIGSNLCKRLVKEKKYKVFSLDNYFTGIVENHIDEVTYIKGNTSDIEKLIDFAPKIIYHLGEYSRVEQSFEDIDLVLDFNIKGTYAVLEFVRKNKTKIVYAGSSTKFSAEGLSHDTSPYTWAKASNTELIKSYGKWFNIDYAITYFYNVYGSNEISTGKYATIIGIFKEQLKKNEALTVVKPGTQKRNFTHINDIIDGLILIGEKGHGDEYGIGSPTSYTILEIAQMFGNNIVMIEERKGNRKDSKLICEKTQKLGWKAKYNLKDYIEAQKKI